MSKHTSFRIGGPAKYFIDPLSPKKLEEVLRICSENGIPYVIVGNGSNLLVSDRGFDGAVIHMGGGMAHVTVKGDRISAGAGVRITDLCRMAAASGLTGLEFAYGIPGTVGGGIFMNAGAYGGELGLLCTAVTALVPDDNGYKSVTYERKDCAFRYRGSRFADEGSIVTGAVFSLSQGKTADIRELMDAVMAKRKEKQPLEFPSAGSVFRRPEGHFAGALIESAGLKGTTVGGAQVSEKHAGFIINKGNAACADVKKLIGIIQDRVFETSGVKLECEIRFIGDDD